MPKLRTAFHRKTVAWSIAVVLLLGLTTAGWPADGPAIESDAEVAAVLKRIEATTAGVTSLAAEFTQIKKLAAFDRDLEMTGRLFMQRPDHFAWHVNHPIRYRMVIKDETLLQWDAVSDNIQKLSLKDNPQFTALSRQMEMWFSGRYNTLLNDYRVSLLGDNPIRLRFHPRKQALAADFIEHITVTFEKNTRYIREFDLLEASQDRTLIRFSQTRINPALDESAWDVRGSSPDDVD